MLLWVKGLPESPAARELLFAAEQPHLAEEPHLITESPVARELLFAAEQPHLAEEPHLIAESPVARELLLSAEQPPLAEEPHLIAESPEATIGRRASSSNRATIVDKGFSPHRNLNCSSQTLSKEQ